MSHPTVPSGARAATRVAGRAGTAWSRLALVLALLAAALLGAAPTQAEAYATKSPSGLTVSAKTTTTATLVWKPVAKAKMYRLQYSTSSKMSKAKYRRVAKTTGTLTELKAGTTYYVKVRVIDTDGHNLSAYSKAVKAKTPEKQPTPSPTPSPTPTPSPSPTPGPAAGPLRVASYNIKCANCYSGLPNEGTWQQRRTAVVDTILGQDLDVVGLEEAGQAWLKDDAGKSYSLSQFEDLRNRLGGSWTLTNANRNNCVRSSTPSGCVYKDQGASQDTKIIYDSSRVEMLAQGSKKLPFVDADDNDRYVAWAQLRQRSTGNRFMFAVTHLEGTKDKDGATTYYDLRAAQTRTALDAVADHNADHLPVVFVGDFNSSRFFHDYNPTNAPYDVLVDRGLIDPTGSAFASTKSAPGATVGKRINTWVDSFNQFNRTVNAHRSWINGANIDYLFVSPSVQVPEMETVVNMDAAGQFVGTIPSDHNMIRASLVLPKTS